MYFRHATDIWRDFPELIPGVISANGIRPDVSVEAQIEPFYQIARQRLAGGTESELPEVQAWRRAFSRMGLKPTQYRCASEALLRRFRKEDTLPKLHPLIDLCNAISLAFAIPIAALDSDKVVEGIEVRYATGEESYLTFAGEIEHPEPGEVIFADAANQAHARRWTNRQSGLSAVSESTSSVLIVSEAMHATASTDMTRLIEAVSSQIGDVWGANVSSKVLTPLEPEFSF